MVFNQWLSFLSASKKYSKKIFLFIVLSAVFTLSSVAAEDTLISLTRNALISLSPQQVKNIQSLSITSCGALCVSFPSLSGVTFKIEVDKNVKTSHISFDESSRTLTISSVQFLEGINTSSDSLEVLRRFLVSHEFHPYLSHHTKPSQVTALQAFKQALREGALSFLHISPTGTGKSVVLAKALKHRMESSTNKLFIVTADQINLIDQLESEIREELKDSAVRIVNWNTVRDRSKTSTFAHQIEEVEKRNVPTVLVITSQSLKPRFNALSRDRDLRGSYEKLIKNLNSIYIDEAHHLGATKTKTTIAKLIRESHKRENKDVLLYGTTATPVHEEVELKDLFEREHWSYLNERQEDFFRTHSLEQILVQLSKAINRGDITPFDDLYVLGEESFKNSKGADSNNKETGENKENTEDIFINTQHNSYYELNPKHYNRLAELLFPIFQDNKKGFILASTIAEAQRLAVFFNQYFNQIPDMEEMRFEAYHSEMTREERQAVTERSTSTKKRHYIVAVRALDEGINLPHLSAYVDLNANVSIKKMMHRMGRVLRLYAGKMTSDVVFLINYRNEGMVEDTLKLMEEAEKVSFRGGVERQERRKKQSLSEVANAISKEDLLKIREELRDSVISFWGNRKDGRFLRIEELLEAIKKYNQEAPKSKRITTQPSYKKHYKEIEGAHSAPDKFYGAEWKKVGKWPGFFEKLGLRQKLETPEELIEAVRKYNQEAPKSKRITTKDSYNKHYKEIKGAPSTPDQFYGTEWEKVGKWRGFFAKLDLRQKLETPEELIEAVREYNRKAPESKRITSEPSYNKHYKEIEGAPSTPNQYYGKEEWERIGKWRGFFKRLGIRKKFETPEELIEAVRKYNQEAPKSKRITTKDSYKKHYKEIEGAPSTPNQYYGKEEWERIGKWPGFFEKLGLRKKFETPEELIEAVRKYNQEAPKSKRITTKDSYNKHYKEIDGAPSNPGQSYGAKWEKIGKWPGFFAKLGIRQKLETPEELIEAVREYNRKAVESKRITTLRSYKKHYKEIEGAPSTPNQFYGDKWKKVGKWPGFFEKLGLRKKFETPEELIEAVRKYNRKAPESKRITTLRSYKKHYKEIEGAPSNPNRTYGAKWKKVGKWRGFFKKCKAVKNHSIREILYKKGMGIFHLIS